MDPIIDPIKYMVADYTISNERTSEAEFQNNSQDNKKALCTAKRGLTPSIMQLQLPRSRLTLKC